VPQHVDVNLEWESGALANAFDQHSITCSRVAELNNWLA
jgi:hypothetical protein